MAKAKTKKITVSEFRKAVNDNFQNVVEYEWCGLPIAITKTISMKDALEFISEVVNACFSEDSLTYVPTAKDVAIRIMVIRKYTNISLPESYEDMYDLLYRSDIVSAVAEEINRSQFMTILQSIDENIDYIKSTNVSFANKQLDSAGDKLEELINTVSLPCLKSEERRGTPLMNFCAS
jgi:hypothetical protein